MTTKVYEAIAAVQAALAQEGISKDRKNDQQGYKFRGIDDIYNALAPVLAKNKLCILPRVTSRECVERTTAKGNAIFYVTVCAEFDFVAAEDGSKHTVVTYGEAMDSADKATNKAMSAAYKYACMQAFAIPTEGDNDADSTTHEVKAHSAADGAFDKLDAKAKLLLTKAAKSIHQSWVEGKEWAAFESANVFEGEERIALWELLRPYSDLRAHLKEMSKEARKPATNHGTPLNA